MKLTEEQIKNWRRAMAAHGWGAFALIAPDKVIIAYAQKVKQLFKSCFEDKEAKKPKPIKKRCPPHGNVITGQRGKYCIDCECYI